jgi:hypothetical protein
MYQLMSKHFNHLDRVIKFRVNEDLTVSILAAACSMALTEAHVATLGTCRTSARETASDAKRREGNAFNREEGSDLLAHLEEPILPCFKLWLHGKASEKSNENR